MPETDCGVIGIDHVAQALQPGRMDSFVLFYRALFGLTADALWELPDPFGLVRSRAMTDPSGSVRLPLNISESGKTSTGRFVSSYAGAGVHHIALATRDIAATLTQARGAPIMPIPANYYDDLAARWDLSDAALTALRAQALLYDRDDAGEYLQAYTDPFDDRFFFEFVERRGYRGFGAVNAAVRMAAQAQRRRQAP
jgi:4-hydroxyphenylpyruvate dioxygenase